MSDRIVMSAERIRAALTEAERRLYADAIGKQEARDASADVRHHGSYAHTMLLNRIDLPWAGCSTCRSRMRVRQRPVPPSTCGALAPDHRTRGHFRPRFPRAGASGRRFFAHQCFSCNQDQGERTLQGWAWKLRRSYDPRADIVDELVAYLRTMGLTDNDL